jgi:urate oxidase
MTAIRSQNVSKKRGIIQQQNNYTNNMNIADKFMWANNKTNVYSEPVRPPGYSSHVVTKRIKTSDRNNKNRLLYRRNKNHHNPLGQDLMFYQRSPSYASPSKIEFQAQGHQIKGKTYKKPKETDPK